MHLRKIKQTYQFSSFFLIFQGFQLTNTGMKAYQSFWYAGNTFQQPGDFPLPGQSLLEPPNTFCCQATLQLSKPSKKCFSITEYYKAKIIKR